MPAEDGTLTFVAPNFGRYVFFLVVSDGRTSSLPDEVRIIAVFQNAQPIADAGPDQTVALGDFVQLEGSGSEDTFLGEIVSYRWEAPEGITLQQADGEVANFVASTVREFVIVLVVSDGSLESIQDEVTITVEDLEGPPDSENSPEESEDASDG